MKKTPIAHKARSTAKKPLAAHTETSLQGMWSGTVSFSLVAIPVTLVKAVEPGRISFHLLHATDYSPLERKMICPVHNKIVSPQETVRGYESEAGKYIVVTNEELESVSPDRSRTIEIQEFIDINDVDPIYFDHPYFLTPLKGGEKSYHLLAEAMHAMNRAGIAKFVMDEREYLVLLKSKDGALAINTLHYSDEILPASAPGPDVSGASSEEINSIKKSIKSMMKEFTPDKYANSRREKILNLLHKKAKAQVESPEIDDGAKTEGMADLMSALQESMRKVKKSA
jgi:DNA end-binding protein Ku